MKKFLLYVILFPVFASTVFAQNRQLTGKVTDVAGLPLAGVTVTEKATRRAVATGADGAVFHDC